MSKYNTAVIVARFQLDELHEGHRLLMDSVTANHEKVILFLGNAPFMCMPRNPLPFQLRKSMVQELYPNVQIGYINDCRTNEEWSVKLDTQIKNMVNKKDTICLYGSRDSFIPYYTGGFPTQELIFEKAQYESATSIRNRIAKEITDSKDFRKGIIWAVSNIFHGPISTVDVALVDRKAKKVLLAKTTDETDGYCFVGAVLKGKETHLEALHRVCKEKVNINVVNILYHGSYTINDWRLRGEDFNYVSNFYTAEIEDPTNILPKDKVINLEWFDINKDLFNIITKKHKEFLHSLISNV